MSSQSMWFWKGTMIGYFPASAEYVKKQALEMILLGIKQNCSKEEQIKLYTEQLNDYEKIIYQSNGEVNKYFPKIQKKYELTQINFLTQWTLNIAALLIMKKIQNNNEYGYTEI